MASRTMFEKIWESHVVRTEEDGTALLYVDRHLTHEVTSPQAFEGLQLTGRNVRRTQATIAVPDHNVPTTDRDKPIEDAVAAKQIEALQENCRTTGVPIFDIDDIRQGIVHVIGPEQGLTLPRISSWPLLVKSGRPAEPGMSSNTRARPSGHCQWKAA